MTGHAASRRRSEPAEGSKLASQLLRFSSFHSVALFLAQGVALGSTFVLVNLLSPTEYGRFALLLLYAAAVALAISLVTKPGTMRRVFGSAGDDDDDEDPDSGSDPQSAQPEASLGTGLVLTALAGAAAIAASAAFATSLSGSTPGALAWAACVGVFMSVAALASGVVWIERRPGAFAALNIAQPCLAAAGSITLVAMGEGAEGAVAGIAAGSAVAALAAVVLVRRSLVWTFSGSEVVAILRAGAPRIPVVLSFWIVGYAGVFLVSEHLATADVGLFHFAARVAGIAVFVSASYRMALRPLLRSLAFAEAESDHGGEHARGTQLLYFLLLGTGVLLAVALFADPVVRIAPASYAEAATLAPLLAAGLLVPRLLQVLNKCVKFPGKRRLFPVLAVAGAVGFCVGANLLLPEIGSEGIALAMGAAFALPVFALGVASQSSPSPIAMPYRNALLAAAAAAACWAAYALISPDSLASQLALALALLAGWVAAIVLTGAFPKSHRKLIRSTLAGAARPRGERLDPRAAIGALNPRQRDILRKALEEGSRGNGDEAGNEAAERALRMLQRSARAAGGLQHRAEPSDPQLFRYLFKQESFAAHDAVGRQLIRAGGIEPRELSQLEELVADLRDCPDEAWR